MIDWTEELNNLPFSLTYKTPDGERDMRTVLWDEQMNRRIGLRGTVVFTRDDRAVQSISKNGFFAVLALEEGERRELDLAPGPDGVLHHAYYLNGERRPFDGEAREWFAGVVLRVIRWDGPDGDVRARWILARGGTGALLDEIGRLGSDCARSVYISALLESGPLDHEACSAALGIIEEKMDSVSRKAALLSVMAERVQQDPQLLESFGRAVESMDDDYEARQVLTRLGTGPDLDPGIVYGTLSLSRLLPDCGKAKLLVHLAPLCREREAYRTAYLKAAAAIESRYERKTAVKAIGYEMISSH